MTLDGNAVRSVDRAAALLLALGESQGEAGVTELARKLGLHKSTASRLLATLQKRGLVEQDEESGKYRLGHRRHPARRARRADARPARIAMPELERLARLTHETTGLGVLDGDQLLTVAQADGPNLVAVGDWTGRSVPLHCVAAGKVLMAALAEREVMRLVRRGLDTRSPSGRSPTSSRSSRSWPGSAGAATRRRSASTSPASTRSRRRCTTRAARSSRRSTCGGRRSGSPRGASRSWPRRSARRQPRSPSASAAPTRTERARPHRRRRRLTPAGGPPPRPR